MPDWRPPSDHDAAERARVWLDRQHAQVHAQVLQLLGEAPTEAISQALGSLSTAELRALLAQARDPNVTAKGEPRARAIAAARRIGSPSTGSRTGSGCAKRCGAGCTSACCGTTSWRRSAPTGRP